VEVIAITLNLKRAEMNEAIIDPVQGDNFISLKINQQLLI
jgi:hypothetical protein